MGTAAGLPYRDLVRTPHSGWLDDSGPHRERLVDDLVRAGAIRSDPVLTAFATVPRELFVPRHALTHGVASVYRNEVLVTVAGRGGVALSSSSQPQLMAAMLESLQVAPGMRVLEIGTGTGYNAALLATLVGPRGRVVSVEVDPGVAEAARSALAVSGLGVDVLTGDGAAGAPAQAPFDRVIVTASADGIPRAWLDQVVEGGLVEVPLRLNRDETQAVSTLRRHGARLESVEVLTGRFMPLRPDDRRDGPSPAQLPLLTSVVDAADAVRLAGAAVAGLDATDRERLVGSLRVERRQALGVTAPPWDLVMFVSLEVPSGLLVSRWPELSVGVLSPDGGLALVEGRRTDGHVPRPLHVVAHGSSSAEAELMTVVGRWVELGCPGVRDLVLEVEVTGATGDVSHRWGEPSLGARSGY